MNKISLLHADDGTVITEPAAIGDEIIQFYKGLLGSAADRLPGIDLPTIRNGTRLSAAAGYGLCVPVTRGEIDQALAAINDDKAPGIDGYNAVFFKKAWHIIKEDVYQGVLSFFQTGVMPLSINCTKVTLVPKVPQANHVKLFRPIACCSLLYKILSKILTSRLQQVVGEVVSEFQSGFIPGRHLVDNILMATELIKGYGRKHISPRCVLKVDLKKAYDSLEWSFLEELGFPAMFVRWVLACISTVSYTIMVNGSPTVPFRAKKGLRQGAKIQVVRRRKLVK